MIVKPKKGVLVRRIETPFAMMPEEGVSVPDNTYYRRRVKEGSLVKISKPDVTKPKGKDDTGTEDNSDTSNDKSRRRS